MLDLDSEMIDIHLSDGNAAVVSLRHARPEDEAILLQLFVDARPDLEGLPIPDRQAKRVLIEHQYRIEREWIAKLYPAAQRYLVLWNGEPIGRLDVHNGAAAYRVLHIAVFPEYRNRGVGSGLLALVLRMATAERKKVRLSVGWYNRAARSLYERLGFVAVEDSGVHCEMQWSLP